MKKEVRQFMCSSVRVLMSQWVLFQWCDSSGCDSSGVIPVLLLRQ
jgi:hypothetical protein